MANKKLVTIEAKNSKNVLLNATDTFHELLIIFAGSVLVGGSLYAIFEGKSFWEGLLWAAKTAFVVGYGDVPPTTAGAYVTGMALMTFTMFVMIPLVTALMTKKAIENGTLKRLDDVADRLEQTEKRKTTKK